MVSCRLSVYPFVCQSFIHPSIFSFLDYNVSKCQWIVTKLGVCIDVVEIWFGIASGQILSIFDRVICPQHDNGRVLSFQVFIL